MNITKSLRLLLLVLAVSLLVQTPVEAASSRQYYSRYWHHNGNHYYRPYYYRPTPSAAYRSHYVLYYPSRPRYYYYYNPYSKKCWGRYDRINHTYSTLQPADQNESVANIPESAFPPGGPMPGMPESTDGARMDAPPSGLPPDESTTLSMQQMQEMGPSFFQNNQQPPRQLYSEWCKSGGYYYRTYYCQAQPGADYHCHRCIYYPSQPRYVYYYNPTKKCYWGRYDLESSGYSLLAQADRKEKLADIPASAFPTPAQMPPIPESQDHLQMKEPPKELPE